MSWNKKDLIELTLARAEAIEEFRDEYERVGRIYGNNPDGDVPSSKMLLYLIENIQLAHSAIKVHKLNQEQS